MALELGWLVVAESLPEAGWLGGFGRRTRNGLAGREDRERCEQGKKPYRGIMSHHRQSSLWDGAISNRVVARVS